MTHFIVPLTAPLTRIPLTDSLNRHAGRLAPQHIGATHSKPGRDDLLTTNLGNEEIQNQTKAMP